MRLKFGVILFTFGMFFASCKKEITMQEYMVGDWETKYINLNMPTYHKSDSLYVLEDDFTKSNAILAQSNYKKDSTFSAWYLTPKKEKTTMTDGKWFIKNDSLYIEFTVNNVTTKAAYFVEKTADGFQGESLSDWDKDGEKDDFLIMKAKRINLKE
jgi:hypothetical protein